MDTTSSEILGHFVYDESLTYDELLLTEEHLIKDFEDLLDIAGAEHIDFTPMGDALMLQCSFVGHKVYIFRKLTCKVAEILPQEISGRLVCLSHTLNTCHVYWLHRNEWFEQTIEIPIIPSEDLKHWRNEDSSESFV